MKQTRKRPINRMCDDDCPYKHTGYVNVLNEKQFKTAKGNLIPDQFVLVFCNGPKGEWMSQHNGKNALPIYDPATMTLPGQAKQKELF